VIKNTTLLSKKLIQGTGWVNAEVERGFKALGWRLINLERK